jgi:hypothetical protein
VINLFIKEHILYIYLSKIFLAMQELFELSVGKIFNKFVETDQWNVVNAEQLLPPHFSRSSDYQAFHVVPNNSFDKPLTKA